MHDEWNKWQDVCYALKVAGAVTDKDLSSPQSQNSTPGQMAIHAIRAWGESLAALKKGLNK